MKTKLIEILLTQVLPYAMRFPCFREDAENA